MRSRGRAAAVAVALATATAACAPSPPPTESLVRCDAPMSDPAGFEVTQSFEEPTPTHIGLRRSLADGAGRQLHLFAGIAGDLGEGLPARGTLALADGGIARLLGRDGVWVLAWDGMSPCTPYGVLGVDMSRAAFIALLCRARVLGTSGGAC